MQNFTLGRHGQTVDECWIVQHNPVYTLGQAGKKAHILDAKTIPIIQSDRGGQVTYHGPGQWVFYLMMDLKRKNMGIRQFVSKLEQSVIDLLALRDIKASANPDAPGVYVDGAKVAALGLRIKRRYTYHGISLNVDMDLDPFNWINPCGYKGLKVINTTELNAELTQKVTKVALIKQIMKHFEIDKVSVTKELPEAWSE
jgi:lipoyl(octanoyl) transferase